ncbi:hypothetical protein SEVCU120_2070 [Staphylococcus epidermidis VCU120]|jgi:uncharacterized membrane protein|uniref:hypothetical protein n=2 Tax=Staphylococcus epidermidis TaxID=1282 RepID=UPI00024E20DA|nr:hypothetical protein [Staphylococcus epidermidis]EHR84379.1 hypothetical protein SEVCU120_2070 [Staphylococcus epidermidis VCU120]PIH06456.1 hypothetical protein CTJ00_12625 [Staphylococcus epidermidis]
MNFKNMSNSEIIEYVVKKKKKKYRIIFSVIIIGLFLVSLFYSFDNGYYNMNFAVLLIYWIMLILFFTEIVIEHSIRGILYAKHSKEVIKYKKFRTIKKINELLKGKGCNEKEIDQRQSYLNGLSEHQLNQYYLEILDSE